MKIKREIGLLLITAIIFLAAYLAFAVIPEVLPSEPQLNRSDWLQFIGMFLAFSGTVFVGCEAYWLASDRNRELDERRRWEVHPILAVEAINVNVNATVANLQPTIEDYRNAHIRIKNISDYPALNIVFADTLVASALEPTSSIDIVCRWQDSDDFYSASSLNPCVLLDSRPDHKRRSDGFPANVILQYDDIDGWFAVEHIAPIAWAVSSILLASQNGMRTRGDRTRID